MFRPIRYNKVQKVSHAGFSFGSKAEARTYDYLKSLELAGEIRNIKCQDSVYLTAARILYKPDFRFEELQPNGEWITCWGETKGFCTALFQIKKRLWAAGYGPGKLFIFKPRSKDVYLDEVVTPRTIEASGLKNDLNAK